MNICNFKTRTNYIRRKNLSVDGYWPIAIDIGYSGVKAFSPNSVLCFPSFARPRKGAVMEIGQPKASDIMYRDSDGVIWNVGELANNSIRPDDVDDSLNTLYSRYRYDNPMFKVLIRAGLAMAMRNNEVAEKSPYDRIVVQSGLPAKYLQSDMEPLKDAFSGEHYFEMKFGDAPWRSFAFDIDPKDVQVTQQPLGAYYSACLGSDGQMTPLGKRMFRREVVVLDGGFGTVDSCRISAKTHDVTDKETFPGKAMMEVFRRTVSEIESVYGTEIAVHALQPYLATGTIPVINRKERKQTNIMFEEMLLRHTYNVCDELLNRVELVYNSFMGIDFLVTAGGTSAVWSDRIAERYKAMEGLQILGAGQHDNLPEIYDIVRGYYLFMVSLLRAKK